MAFAALAVLPAPANAEVADYQWYREAAKQALRRQTLPPVEVSSVTVDGNVLTARISVRQDFGGNSIDFVLAAPAGEITSASVSAIDFTDGNSERETISDDGVTSALALGADTSSEQPVIARHLAYVRGHRLVKLQVSPMVSGAAGARLRTGTLRIYYKDAINGNNADVSKLDASGENPLDEMVQQLVANPADLGRFALPLDEAPAPTDDGGPPLGDPGAAVARFETTGEGFVRFTGADLAGVGVDLAKTDISRISAWTNGEQQPLLADISQPRPVEPADEFTLYSQENHSTYTASRVYWIRDDKPALAPTMDLTGGQPPPPRSTASPHFIAHQTVQQDTPPVLTVNDQFLTILGYRWVWWTWTPTGTGSALPNPRKYDKPGQISFDLPGLSDTKESTTLSLHFYAHQWPREQGPVPFQVEVNGTAVDHIQVMEPEGLEHTISVSPEILKAKSNRLTLTPQVTTDTQNLPELCFDRLEVSYPRTYEFTSSTLEFNPPSDGGGAVTLGLDEPSTTILLADVSATSAPIQRVQRASTGGFNITTSGPASSRYAAATPAGVKRVTLRKVDRDIDLRSAENRADVVVIAWPDFIEDLKPWVAAKTAKGHVVKVVDVNDIYDQFGFGHLSPHAIRAFLRHGAIHWQGSDAGPAASVVLLVGDSTSAYRNEFKNDVINYVPTMRTTVGGDIFASDQWYVSLFGTDAFADALIGRFSVNSRENLRNVLSKQLDYESASASGAWKNTLGFIADHSEFEESVDRIMKQVIPSRFFLNRIMMSELPWIDNYYFPEEVADAQKAKVSPAATGRIRDLFNKGAAVVTYFGHGSPNIWSTERMWFGGDSPNSDNLMLTNRDRLSIVINMTCNSGAIDYPQPRWNVCISEDFMRVPNGGAVACFVPSGPGLTVQHERLMMEVGRCLFGEDQRPLGYSLQLALWRYLAAGNPEELARMYILLGDPLLMPHIAEPVDASRQAVANATEWPGTILLPPVVTGVEGGGSFQLHRYQDHIESRRIQPFTSATLALPKPEAASDSAQALALSVDDPGTTNAGSASTFVPVEVLPALNVLQWKRTDDAADGDATATLELRVRNESSLPLRAIRIGVVSDGPGEVAAYSLPINFEPLADSVARVDVPTAPGLNLLKIIAANGANQRPLEAIVPVAVVGLRPDALREEIAPAVVDTRSLTIIYRETANGVAATVTGQAYMLARESLSNLRVGLEDAAGVVAPDSIATVPPTGPGEGTRISMAVTLPTQASASDFKIRFDPAGFYPEFARFPAEPIQLGAARFSDVAIESVVPSNTSPTDGETVFFDVTIANRGEAQADGIKVEGFSKLSSGTQEKIDSQVTLPNPMLNLKPGETQTVRLRWDPFRNAGANDLFFTATSTYDLPDLDPANNRSDLTIVARTKAELHSVLADVLPLSREDAATTQIRMLARVRNDGQTDAQGLRVAFYSSPNTSPETYLGDTEIPVIPAGQTKDAILTYKLKPGEERKPFAVTFEVTHKGSRQRILLQ